MLEHITATKTHTILEWVLLKVVVKDLRKF